MSSFPFWSLPTSASEVKAPLLLRQTRMPPCVHQTRSHVSSLIFGSHESMDLHIVFIYVTL